MDNTLEGVQEIFRDVLDQPDLVLAPESNAGTVDGWDSLAQIDLITLIQERYQIRFALSELQGLKNVGDMVNLIKVKRAA